MAIQGHHAPTNRAVSSSDQVEHPIPEGFVSDGPNSMRFIGAPDWFRPEFESFEFVFRRMLGKKWFLRNW